MNTILFRRVSFLVGLAAVGVVANATSAQAQTTDANRNQVATASALVVEPVGSLIAQADSTNTPGGNGTATELLSQINTGPTQGDIDDRIESSPPNPLNQTTPDTTTPGTSPNNVQPQPIPGTTPDTTFPSPQPIPGTTTPDSTFPDPAQTQPVPGTTTPDGTFPSPTETQQFPDTTTPETTTPDTTPDTTTEPAIVPGTATRGGASYIGVGGNIGFGGETTLSEGAFAVYSKIGLTETFSIRPAAYIGDNTVVVVPITADFPPAETGIAAAQLNVAPYIGAGIAISTGQDSTVGALITGGVDVPLSQQFTATAGVNIGFIDDTEVGLLVGIGYNF